MIDEIPLEEIDKEVSKNKYVLIRTGGFHPFYNVKQAPEKYRQNIWPWIKKIKGNLQHLRRLGNRKKSYLHLIIGKAFVPNPRGLVHQTDGGDGVIDHINNHQIDYRIENLRWLTRSENSTGYPKEQRKTREEIYLHMKGQGWVD